LPHDSIVENAIAAAGGLSEAADPDAINLAQPVAAGERVYVPPEQGNLEVDGDEGPHTDPANGGLIPINRALEPELEDLPGIGPSLAAAIVKYRDQHGPFASIDALLSVPGIGPAKLEAIRDLITVD
jgi:competence protein ComEA